MEASWSRPACARSTPAHCWGGTSERIERHCLERAVEETAPEYRQGQRGFLRGPEAAQIPGLALQDLRRVLLAQGLLHQSRERAVRRQHGMGASERARQDLRLQPPSHG